MSTNLDTLLQQLRNFAAERDWGQFHSPKNLACALSVEAAELLEIFQWMSEQQSRQLSAAQRAAAEYELADVCCYLLYLADQLDIDLLDAAARKIALNAQRYPVEISRGSSAKSDRALPPDDATLR